jgi:hypothetical protein
VLDRNIKSNFIVHKARLFDGLFDMILDPRGLPGREGGFRGRIHPHPRLISITLSRENGTGCSKRAGSRLGKGMFRGGSGRNEDLSYASYGKRPKKRLLS